MNPSLESFAELVPRDLLDQSGEVFYSGRAAFSNPADVYVLGINPGGDPSNQCLRKVRENIEYVSRQPDRYSVYYDDNAWEKGRNPNFQRRIRLLLDRFEGISPDITPSSNCIFIRSKNFDALPAWQRQRLANGCWHFHEAVISALGVRLILCLGKEASDVVRGKLRATREIGRHGVDDLPKPTGFAYESNHGMVVVRLPHPSSRIAWKNPRVVPSGLVQKMLERVRSS